MHRPLQRCEPGDDASGAATMEGRNIGWTDLFSIYNIHDNTPLIRNEVNHDVKEAGRMANLEHLRQT